MKKTHIVLFVILFVLVGGAIILPKTFGILLAIVGAIGCIDTFGPKKIFGRGKTIEEAKKALELEKNRYVNEQTVVVSTLIIGGFLIMLPATSQFLGFLVFIAPWAIITYKLFYQGNAIAESWQKESMKWGALSAIILSIFGWLASAGITNKTPSFFILAQLIAYLRNGAMIICAWGFFCLPILHQEQTPSDTGDTNTPQE